MGPRPGRHRSHVRLDPEHVPDWLNELIDDNKQSCLRAVGEEAYQAKFWADNAGAITYPSAIEPYSAALKELVRLNNTKLTDRARSQAGARAMRKFWEAKVAARRELFRGRK